MLVRKACCVLSPKPSKTDPSVSTDLPGNPAVGDESDDLTAKVALDHRPPGDEGEFLGVLDQGVAAGGELHRLAVGAADRLAGRRHPERHGARRRQFAAGAREFAAFQRREKVPAIAHAPVRVPARIAVGEVM